MARVFLWVAASEVFLFAGAGVLGLVAREASSLGHPAGAALRYHVGAALFIAVFGCLMHAAVLTYFAVTGKLIHQAVALGKLPLAPFERHRETKKRITRLVAAGAGSFVVAVATGAWRLSGTSGARWHLLASLTAAAVNVLVFYRQYALIWLAQESLSNVMASYTSTRAAAQSDPAGRRPDRAPGLAPDKALPAAHDDALRAPPEGAPDPASFGAPSAAPDAAPCQTRNPLD